MSRFQKYFIPIKGIFGKQIQVNILFMFFFKDMNM